MEIDLPTKRVTVRGDVTPEAVKEKVGTHAVNRKPCLQTACRPHLAGASNSAFRQTSRGVECAWWHAVVGLFCCVTFRIAEQQQPAGMHTEEC